MDAIIKAKKLMKDMWESDAKTQNLKQQLKEHLEKHNISRRSIKEALKKE